MVLVHLALALALPVPDDPSHPPADPPIEAPAEPAPDVDPLDGATLFRVGRYREAAAAFAREYETNPDPALLFGRAAALKRSGDCLSALSAFEAFIAAGPPAPDVEEAERQIDDCQAIVEATAKAAMQRSNAAEPAPTATAAEPAPSDRAPDTWYRDPIGGTLVGTGAAILVGGAGLYGASFGVAARERPDMQSEHESRRRQVRSLAATGIPLMAAGAAILVGGIVRWAVLARRQRAQSGAGMLGSPALVWRF
jgi:hypothetical protein